MTSVIFQNYFICLFSIFFYYFFFKKPKASRLRLNLPPSPPSLPIVGHLHLVLSPLFHKSLKKVSAKYGPLLHLRVFKFPIVVVSSASVAYEIFRAHDVNVSSHGFTPIEDSLLFGSSGFISAPYGDYWRFMKKLTELLIGGSDTSAQTTQWIMAEITDKPNILTRLREEIDSVVGNTRLIQETDLLNLSYLQAVVKEGLRLHPPGPVLLREFQQGCKIGEFYIPEKKMLLVNSYAIMRDPHNWEDPDEFKPERFLASSRSGQEDEKRERALKYIPFGSGRRGCLGEDLAYVFLATAVGMMVQGFEWQIKEEKVNMEEAVVGMSLAMSHPPKFTPIARTLNPLSLNMPNRKS
ncbi:unnamed protein product [Arabidopsis halleri]